LQLAVEGILDASAAFLPMPGGLSWSRDKKRVTLTKLWLGHVAMTPDPAYESARVLAVRSGPPPRDAMGDPGRVATPNLDVVRSWELAEQAARVLGERH
jgi:hypothetical protein